MKHELPDQYTVQGELGRGGMGVVYRAFDRLHQRPVAVKVLAPEAGEERFAREAEQLASLSHPNVVAFYTAGRHQGRDYLVMELVEGGNLLTCIRRPRPLEELVEVFRQLCEGLAHIHGHGIVHRDLKPENILLAPDGTPKISDFGLARRLQGASRLTADGAIVGTYTYLAPEQIDSSQVGPAADLYALGAVMYEAFTGRPLFEAPTEYELLQCHLKSVPVSPRALRPDLSPSLERLILRLVRKQPHERPASAREVARMLADPDQPDDCGRQPLLERLEEHLARCLAGQPASALLTAPAGLGRSRLLWELADRLTSRGLRVLTLSPTPDGVMQASTLYTWLGGEGDRLALSLISGGPAAGAEALRQKLAQHPGTVLLVDDLERLDATSQAVLGELARRTPTPGTGWLLSEAATRLTPPDTALVVEVPPLFYDDLCHLAAELRSRLTGEPIRPLEPEVATRLATHAGGSPRRLKWLVWLGERDLLTAVKSLEEPQLRLLQLACLAREPFDLPGEAHALVAAGLLEETPTGHYLLAAEPLRSHLAEELGERSRRRLYGQLARTSSGPTRALYLARAEQPAQAVGALVEEAERCQACGAFAEAHELWERALACLGRETTSNLRLRLMLGAGVTLAGCLRWDEAVLQLEAVLAEPRSGLPSERVLRLAAWRGLAEVRARQGADGAQLLNLVRQGLSEANLPPEPAPGPGDADLKREAVGLYVLAARTHLGRGDATAAGRLVPGALGLARLCEDRPREAELLVLEGRLHRLEGRHQACEQCLFKSLRLARESLGPGHTLRCQLELGELYVGLVDVEKAEMSLAQALELARELADAEAQATALVQLAWLHQARGQGTPALDLLEEAAGLAPRAPVLVLAGWAWLRQGEPRRAEERLRQALKLEECEPAWAMGHLFRQEGRGREAEEWFRRALAGAEGDSLGAARARVGLALVLRAHRSAAARTEADQAVRLLERGGGLELGLARWAQGRVRATQGDEAAGTEALRLAERLLGQALPPLELWALVQEARDDLKGALRGLPVAAPPPAEPELPPPVTERPRAWEPVALKSAPPARPRPAPSPPVVALPRPRPRRPRSLWWLLGLLLFAAGVAAGIYSLPAPTGTLLVRSNVDGAQVVLDGVKQTRLSKRLCKLDSVPPGPHLVEVRATGYKTGKKTVKLGPGANLSVAIPLEKAR